ncbi:radical SAM protein [Clostridiales bacterium]|nr:radical SAM protein [Clostridiales bacterium]
MKEPVNAFELLDILREQNGKEIQRFDNVTRYLSIKAREKGVPISGQFELTPLCNFSCKMCYVHLNVDQLNDRKILSVDTWKDLMHQAWEAGMMNASLTGGECLAYPGFDELFLYLHSLGCQVLVLTNGFLLDDRRIQFFREHCPAEIHVTLYGWNDDVYERVTGKRAFSRVMENIRKAIDAGLPVSISVTPCSFLGEDVLETIRVAKSLKRAVAVNNSIFSPRADTGRAEQKDDPETDMYIRIYRLMNEMNGREIREIAAEMLPPECGKDVDGEKRGLQCGGGRSGFVINWEGTMMPCNQLDMIQAFPLQVGIKKAWEKVNFEANNWPRYSGCDGCAYAEVCNKCAGNQLRFAEPGKKPEQLCEQTKRFVCNGVRYLPDLECD